MTNVRLRAMMRVVPVLLLAAVVGFTLGEIRPSAASRSTAVPIRGNPSRVDPVVLEYATPGWSTASHPIVVPGLALTHEIALAPRVGPAGTGLVAGRAAEGDPGPLPAGLLARLPVPPKAEVVSLLEAQAYRYRRLTPAGLGVELTLYVVPDGKGSGIAIACYAQRSASVDARLRSCERLVNTLALALESAQFSLDLTPDPQYAHQVAGVVASIDRARVVLRAALHRRASAASVSRLATQLAKAFLDASRSLAALQAPPPAATAQATLAGALGGTRQAYLELARAADAADRAGYNAARTHVDAAEARFAAALGGYALLGYV
jgi:hypothetical protein